MDAAFHFPVMSDVLTIGQAETCKKARGRIRKTCSYYALRMIPFANYNCALPSDAFHRRR